MDKQKKIIEMAEVIAKYISSRDFEVKFITNPKSKAFPFSHTVGVAEDLYNAGYRKIPENAVVLTGKKYERWQGQTLNIKKVRKETAEKLAEKVHNLFNRDIKDSVVYTQEEKDILKDFVESIDEICKEITGGRK